MRMAFLGIPVWQKKLLLDPHPSISRKKAEDSRDLPGERSGRAVASPASLSAAFTVTLEVLLILL